MHTHKRTCHTSQHRGGPRVPFLVCIDRVHRLCVCSSPLHKVLDELRHLEDFFTSQNRQARQPMVGLYEQAQACTMVLPRLYLLNTVGACYILSQEAPARVSYYTVVRYI